MHDNDVSVAVARLRALVVNDDEFDISHFALGVIRELKDQQLRSMKSISAIVAGSDQELRLRVVRWLVNEQILDVTDETVRLTVDGYRSLAIAADSDELLSQFLSDRRYGLDRKEANSTMLLILRTFFELRHP